MRSEEDLRSCCDRAKEAGDYGAYLQAKSELVDFYRETFRFEEAFSAAEDVLMLMEELNLEASFRLSYNGSVFVREGLGYLLTFEHLVDTSRESGLVFRPLSPSLKTNMYLIWKKNQIFTPTAEQFIRELKNFMP